MLFDQVSFIYEVIANTITVVGIPVLLLKIARNYRFAKEEKAARLAEQQRLNEQIEIALTEEGGQRKIIFPATIRRSQFTRAEVQGRLSVNNERYNLPYLNTKECLERIDHIYTHSGEDSRRLTIPCSEAEFTKIKPDVLRKSGFILIGFDEAKTA